MKKKSDTELNELFQEIEDSLCPKINKKRIRVLVFGPDLKNEEKSSAKLRKRIISKCREDDYIVVLAEHEEIRGLYKRIFHSANDLCKMEYHLAKAEVKGNDIIDGIVIIPDSEGSFIELGMLAIADKIHDKILILFNKKYESEMSNNFVGLGAKCAFENGNARTKVIDYNNEKMAFDEVSDFLEFRKGRKIWRTWNR